MLIITKVIVTGTVIVIVIVVDFEILKVHEHVYDYGRDY